MQPLKDSELIVKLKRDYPKENPEDLTCVYGDDDAIVYKNKYTLVSYLFDSKINAWLREDTEYWRGIALT